MSYVGSGAGGGRIIVLASGIKNGNFCKRHVNSAVIRDARMDNTKRSTAVRRYKYY